MTLVLVMESRVMSSTKTEHITRINLLTHPPKRKVKSIKQNKTRKKRTTPNVHYLEDRVLVKGVIAIVCTLLPCLFVGPLMANK